MNTLKRLMCCGDGLCFKVLLTMLGGSIVIVMFFQWYQSVHFSFRISNKSKSYYEYANAATCWRVLDCVFFFLHLF